MTTERKQLMGEHPPTLLIVYLCPAIEELARLVSTGLILGFVVKGEIALGNEVGVINNVGG